MNKAFCILLGNRMRIDYIHKMQLLHVQLNVIQLMGALAIVAYSL